MVSELNYDDEAQQPDTSPQAEPVAQNATEPTAPVPSNPAGNPPEPPAPAPAPKKLPRGVPEGAELFDPNAVQDRAALAERIRAHGLDISDLDEEDRLLAESGAQLIASGVEEPFVRKPWYFRPRLGEPVALMNYVCNREGCLYATLDARNAWMHASHHVSLGE